MSEKNWTSKYMLFKGILKSQAGVSFIELILVIAIIGILAAIAIPNFMTYQCKARQSEAKNHLKAIFLAEEVYYNEHKTYASDIGSLAFTTNSDEEYTYAIDSASDNGFNATAQGSINNNTDVWLINEEGVFNNSPNACN